MKYPGLPEAVNESQYLVPRMTRDELRLAITGPVAVGGAEIAPRLVLRVLNDVGDSQDELPLVQHVLMRTWDHWARLGAPGTPIDLPNYEACRAWLRSQPGTWCTQNPRFQSVGPPHHRTRSRG